MVIAAVVAGASSSAAPLGAQEAASAPSDTAARESAALPGPAGPVPLLEVGHAVSLVDADARADLVGADRIHDLLSAGTTGVDVRRSSGSVGAAPSLRFRGPLTLDPDAVPIVYVDGARVEADNRASFGFFVGGQQTSRLDDLAVGDVESVAILKGPAATAIYGADAAAGVVRITTVRGSTDEPARWRASVEQGAAWNPTRWWSLAWNPIRSSVHVPGAKDTTYVQSLLAGTRYGEPFRTGHLQRYAASVSDGGDLAYHLSGELLDREGTVPADGRDRYHLRANASLRPSASLDVSASTAFTAGTVRLPENDDNLFGLIGNALGSPWWGPMTRSDPTRGGEPIETCFLMFEFARATGGPLAERSEACEPVNPFFLTRFEEIGTISNEEEVRRFVGSATATWRPPGPTSHRLTVGLDRWRAVQTEIVPVDPERPFGVDSEGRIDRARNDGTLATVEGASSLELSLADRLASRTTLGVRWQRESRDLDFAIGRRFPAGSPSLEGSAEVTARRDASASARTVGTFLQQRLGWRDRLFVTPAVRVDDVDAVADDVDAALYPSVQVAWLAGREPWWPALFDRARLRFAWGRSGRRPELDAAFARLAPDPSGVGGGEDDGSDGSGAPDLDDPRPERSTEWEVGADLGLAGGRLGLSVTWYERRAEDVLVPTSTGPVEDFALAPKANAATIENRGLEAAVDARLAERDGLRWDVRFTLATSDDEVAELPAPVAFFESAQSHREGHPVGAYFGRPVTVDGSGSAVAGEETYLGTPTPRWAGSMATRLRLMERVTLSARADYAGGHVLHDLTTDFACRLLGGGRDEEGRLRGACPAIFATGPDGRPTREALAKIAASRIASPAPWVHEADYLRLRSVSARLELPASWLAAAGGFARGASLTVSGENLTVWTAYPGTDPEVSESGSHPILRQQFLGLPPERRVRAGLSVTF